MPDLTPDEVAAAFFEEFNRSRSGACHAGQDGDCTWEHCPQLANYQTGCPLYNWHLDEEGNPWR